MITAKPEPSNSPRVVDSLPHRAYRRTERTRVRPSGLIGALALIAAVEWSVSRAGARFLDPVASCWALAARDATTHAPGRDVLLIGDSLVKHGLAPALLDQTAGSNSYNLAIAAGPAPATEALLRHALAAGARPRAVVFDLKAGLLAGGPRYSLRQWPHVLDPLDAWRLIVTARSGAFTAELLINSLLPTFRSRLEIRDAIRAAVLGDTAPIPRLNAIGTRQWSVNHGANLATPRADYDGAVSEAQHREFLSNRLSIHKINKTYARRIIDAAVAARATPYLLLPPAVPQIQARREASGAEAKYETFVRALQSEFPSLVVLDARAAHYPPSAFVDPVHLSVTGALVLSADVGAVLHADRTSPSNEPNRWVRLPTYRARSLPPDLEHVELSREWVDRTAKK